jgi:hypothetical protein
MTFKIVKTINVVKRAASVVQCSEFLAVNPEVLGSIPYATKFSE